MANFMTNIVEDVENFFVATLSESQLVNLRRQEEKLRILNKSLEYRKTDLIYLTKQGFDLDTDKDIWTKTENVKFGRYPGKYKITVKFPIDYPKNPPRIYFKPVKGQKISTHVMRDSAYEVCIAEIGEHQPNSYWKPTMNVKGALQLAYMVVSDEIMRKKIVRKVPVVKETKKKVVNRPSVNIKGTIFATLKTAVTKEMFMREFVNPFRGTKTLKNFTDIDGTWTWGEIAYVFSKSDRTVKSGIIKYYNKKVAKR